MMRLSSRGVVAPTLIALLLILTYASTFNFPFQYDDYNVIVEEPRVHSLGSWWHSMPGMRPLLKLSYTLNWQWDQGAQFFRVVNLLFHFLTSVLVWRFCLAILPYLKLDKALHANIALLSAVLFALHPAHTEVVSYVSGRSTGLMALLCIASSLYFLRFLERQGGTGKSFLVLSVLLWLLAILAKEPAVVLPLVGLLLYALVAARNVDTERAETLSKSRLADSTSTLRPRLASLCLVLLCLGLLCLAILYLLSIPQYQRIIVKSLSLNSLSAQLVNQPGAHLHYLLETLLGRHLNIDYGPTAFVMGRVESVLLGLALLGTVALAVVRLRRWPLISLALLWWFVFLLPSNSIIARPDIVNDRQIYLSSVGPLLFFAVGIARLGARTQRMKGSILLPLVVVSVFSAAAGLRNRAYESEVSLWQASLRLRPDNSRAWNNLGHAYMLDGKAEQAQAAFERSLQLDPKNDQAYFNLLRLKTQ
jgi:protein O-mannosyl-transferase